jgi:hypothetical protein
MEADLYVEECVDLIIGPDESQAEQKLWSWSHGRFRFERPIHRSLKIEISSNRAFSGGKLRIQDTLAGLFSLTRG